MSRKTILWTLAILALLGTASVMTACNNVAGAGEDISSAGHVIASDADSRNLTARIEQQFQTVLDSTTLSRPRVPER